jgi:hypothetical protein
MKLLILLFLALVAGVALLFWLLPLWLAITLVVVIGLPAIWIVWKIYTFFNKIKAGLKALADIIPKEKLCTLTPGEAFRGKGFAFTFPVACEVSETTIADLEALMVKPKFDFPGAPTDALLVISTIPREELKQSLNEKLDGVFSQVQEIQQSEFTPIQVGTLPGEQRTLNATKDGKTVQGETVYLGDQTYSIAWTALATADTFETLSAKYRELASLVQRVPDIELETPRLELKDATPE